MLQRRTTFGQRSSVLADVNMGRQRSDNDRVLAFESSRTRRPKIVTIDAVVDPCPCLAGVATARDTDSVSGGEQRARITARPTRKAVRSE